MAVSTDSPPVSWTCAAPLHFLRGRQREQAELNQMLLDVRSGRSRVLVVRGEAGIGKTALLEYVIAAASDMTVLRAAGVESEMELAYASLHQLCAPLLDRLETLPAPQREALRVACPSCSGARFAGRFPSELPGSSRRRPACASKRP